MTLRPFNLRRPTMSRAAWWQLYRDWLFMSLLSLVMFALAPIPTPTPYFAAQLILLVACVAVIVWLTLIVRVSCDAADRDVMVGDSEFTFSWFAHMWGRISRVRDRFRALGVGGSAVPRDS